MSELLIIDKATLVDIADGVRLKRAHANDMLVSDIRSEIDKIEVPTEQLPAPSLYCSGLDIVSSLPGFTYEDKVYCDIYVNGTYALDEALEDSVPIDDLIGSGGIDEGYTYTLFAVAKKQGYISSKVGNPLYIRYNGYEWEETDGPGEGGAGEDLDAVIAEQRELIEELSEALDNKAGGGTSTPTQEKTVSITANGTTVITADAGYALSKVTANVSIPSDKKPEQTKTVNITENGTVNVAPDSGKVLSGVTVNVNVPTSENKLAKLVIGESVALTAEDLSGVTEIRRYAFYNCYNLVGIDIPSGVTIIKFCAFYDCSALTYVTIPNSVTTIENSAFNRCSALTYVTIPNSVTTIDIGSFYNCSNMELFDFSTHTSVPTIGSNTFDGIPSTCQIIVPADLYDQWISATNWAKYAGNIVPG